MSALDTYYAFKFIFHLTQPWEETDAFEQGIVDKTGKELKTYRQLKTHEEKKAYTKFHRLTYNLKRMLEKVPLAKSTVGRYATALLLIKEETGYMFDKELLEYINSDFDNTILKESIEEIEEFNGVSGVDMGAGGSRYKRNNERLSKLSRRTGMDFTEDKGDDNFSGSAVFDCDSETFQNCRLGKKKYLRYKTYVGEDDIGERIRQYGRNNPEKGIVLRDSKTGAMLYLRRNK